MMRHKLFFYSFLLVHSLGFRQSVFAGDPRVTLAAEPGFTCSAILTGMTSLLPIKAEQEASTLRTLQQLSLYQAYYLKNPNAPSSQKEYLIHAPVDQLTTAQNAKISGQISGILEDAKDPESTDRLLRIGVNLTGKDAAYKYFGELEASVKSYQEMVAKDDLNPELSSKRVAINFYRVVTPLTFMAALSTLGLMTPMGVTLTLLNLHYSWQFLGSASIPMGSQSTELGKLLIQAKNFLDNPTSEKRVLAFSHRYKILPATFQEAQDGFMQTQTLIKESISAHRALVSTPPSIFDMAQGRFKILRPEVSYVTVDMILESTGGDSNDTSLSIYVRATKTKPKPRKPNIPAPERKTEWKTTPEGLVPVPVMRR